MKRYFQNLKSAQSRRMRYILLSYLFAGSIGFGIGLYYQSVVAVIVAVLVTLLMGWKLTGLVYKNIKAPCPLCDTQELTESFSLQCRPATFECKECKSTYVEGVLIEK
jgi:hypothetical protein